MSYTDPSPAPYPGGDIGGFWPMNTENPNSNSSFDNTNSTNPYKRQRNCQNNRPMQPLIPMNNVATGTCHIFYKTRLCQKFCEGNCRNSDRCTFAHGHSDLRNPPPNWQEIVGSKEKDKASGNWDDDQRIIQRMKICRKFYNGEECPYGNKCNFLHECPSRFKSDVVTINREIEDNSALVVPMPAKTRLCGKWETTGFCPFGDKCHFAHGFLELHQPGQGQGGDVTTGGMMHNVLVDVQQQQPLVITPIISTNSLMTDEVRRSKWKVPKKINRIYGDWLDNVPSPPRGIPGRPVEDS